MAVHTYVGARYVPRFMGVYDPTQQYEALDVVDNGTGTSYIARKIVPAGTPLTDTDHWFLYGASSGAIIQLQNDMIQAQNDILSLQGEDQNINAYIKNYTVKNRKVVSLSDSYGMTIDPAWPYYFSAYSGVDAANYHPLSVSGTAFANRGPGYQTFEDLLTTMYTTLGPDDAADITDILVIGGYNDAQYINGGGLANDVFLAIGSFMTYAAANFPNAQVYIGFVGWQVKPGAVITQSLQNALAEYKKCSAWSAVYLTGIENTLYDNRLLNANHPNSNGMIALGRSVAQAWKAGSFEESPVRALITNYNLNSNFGGITTNVVTLNEEIDGKTFNLFSADNTDGFEIRATSMPNLVAGVDYPIFSNNAPINKATFMMGSCIIAMLSNGSGVYDSAAWTYINGVLRIIPMGSHSNITMIRGIGINGSVSVFD